MLMATIQLISGLDYTSIQGRLQELGIIEPYSVDFFASENIGGLSISNENMETFKTEMLENPGQWLISLQELLKILTEWRQFNPTNNINPGTWKISENLLEYGYKAPGISSDNLMQEQAPIQDQSKKKLRPQKILGRHITKEVGLRLLL
ncbi:MAG: hypothetical protein HWD59_05755 [Coxiellaceae bacterium]|nr:MAG: hypothetical protein HWD59_05755 [Coxiellaceae bacterium]